MEDRTRENLNNLLQQLLDAAQAEAAAEDIQAGERLMDAHPAPAASPETIARIKGRMTATFVRRHRIILTLRRSLAAAAIIAFALIVLLDRSPNGDNNVYQATILPPAIWDSIDVAADDLDLARFGAEVHHIETQLQALEAGEDEATSSGTVEEIDTELRQIETELGKG